MSVQISYKKQIIFFMMLIVIFAISVEIILQVIDSFPKQCHLRESKLFDKFSEHEKQVLCEEYNKMAGEVSYNLAPVRLHIPNQHGVYVNINSDGFRGGEIIFSENQYKIFFLGGSTAFGSLSSSDETTIPGYVEKKLLDKGYDVKIVNGGIHSATTIDEFYMLENYFLKFKPDMVIMYDGYNDAGDFNLRKFHISYDEFKNNYAQLNNIPFNGVKVTSVKGTGIINFLEQSNYKTGIGLVIFYKNMLNPNPINTKETTANPKITNFIENYMTENWSKTCSLGEKNGFKTVNFIQPILGTGDRTISENEMKIMNKDWFKNHYLTYLKSINIDVKKVEPCENIFDLRNSFSGMNGVDIYWDEGHMTDFGNEIIAEKITEKLIPIINNDLIES